MMSHHDPNRRGRRSIRLKGYDYSLPGAYFITVCTHRREPVFGQIDDGLMHPNPLGRIVERAWSDLPNHYPHVRLDAFCVMPNHVHGIIVLVEDDRASPCTGGSGPDGRDRTSQNAPIPACEPVDGETRPYYPKIVRHALPEIVRAFKSFSARRINHLRGTPGIPVWQRNYYERIIRDQVEYKRICDYILTNVQRWETDIDYPFES